MDIFWEEEVQQIDIAPNIDQEKFDDDQIGKIFEAKAIEFKESPKETKTEIEDFEQISPKPQSFINVVKVKKEVFEDVSVTEYFLNFNHDYGDLRNLRLRNDFVLNAAKIKQDSNLTQKSNQKEKFHNNENQKSESLKLEQKKADELKIQQTFADDFTKKIQGKD